MKIIENYVAFWTNIFKFDGRSRRSEYWYVVLANIIIGFILGIISNIIDSNILATLYSIVSFIPSIALSIRRLHDTGKSGWWYLIGITGIGAILLIIFFAQDSQPGSNKYGDNPKGF